MRCAIRLVKIIKKGNLSKEKDLKAGHIIKCGKDEDKDEKSGAGNFTTYCLKTPKFI